MRAVLEKSSSLFTRMLVTERNGYSVAEGQELDQGSVDCRSTEQ